MPAKVAPTSTKVLCGRMRPVKLSPGASPSKLYFSHGLFTSSSYCLCRGEASRGVSELDLLVQGLRSGVERVHEYVAQEPKGPRGFCDVHFHDSQDADLVHAGVEDVVVAHEALVVRSNFVAVER